MLIYQKSLMNIQVLEAFLISNEMFSLRYRKSQTEEDVIDLQSVFLQFLNRRHFLDTLKDIVSVIKGYQLGVNGIKVKMQVEPI